MLNVVCTHTQKHTLLASVLNNYYTSCSTIIMNAKLRRKKSSAQHTHYVKTKTKTKNLTDHNSSGKWNDQEKMKLEWNTVVSWAQTTSGNLNNSKKSAAQFKKKRC